VRKRAVLFFSVLFFSMTFALAFGSSQETSNSNSVGLSAPSGFEGSNANRNVQQSAAQAAGTGGARENAVQPAGDQSSATAVSGLRSDTDGGDVPANTEVRATLDTPLSSKTSRPGDRFTATIAQSVSGSNGIVIPAGALVEGEVSGSEQDHTQSSSPRKAKLNLRFRDIVLPNGQSVALVSSLVSLNSWTGGNTQKPDRQSWREPGAWGKDTALNVGTAAGEIATAGPNLGGSLKGFAVGTLAGGGYVVSKISKYVNLPAQTGMVIRLEEGLKVQ
jgi:hypothetical protein